MTKFFFVVVVSKRKGEKEDNMEGRREEKER